MTSTPAVELVEPRADRHAAAPRRRPVEEVAWFVVPLALCPVVAVLRPGSERTAMARGEWLLAWQRSVGVAVEPSIHEWFSVRPALMAVVNVFYLGAHLSAVIATACWLAARHPRGFDAFRRTFALAQVITICIYVAVPVAPLRMILDGEDRPAGGGWTRSMQYELAAMPSGHAVFALVVAIAVWRHAPARWRWVAVAHPACTVLTLVATAHHSLVDVLAGGLVVALATVIVGLAATGSSGRRGRTASGSPDGGCFVSAAPGRGWRELR